MPTTVEVLADAFKEAGTPFLVGHPGGELVELMEAARQRDMRFILIKQEVAGAMLASTWGEITGAPGVCLSTRGPGAANMVNGIAHAFLDRAPLIAITDRYAVPAHEVGLRQRLDHLAIYAPIVKWGTTIDARTVRQQVRRALRTTTAPPPGPVQFDLPQSETTKDAAALTRRAAAAATPPLPRARARCPEARDRAARRGPQAHHPRGSRRALAQGFGGSRPPRRAARRPGPRDLEMQGRDPGGPSAARRLHHRRPDRAQARHAVGPDRRDRARCGRAAAQALALRHPGDRPLADALARCPGARPARGDRRPEADARTALPNGATRGSGWGEKAAATFRHEVSDALNTPSRGLSPQRAMEVARAVLPRDTIATCDAGASRLLVVQKWQAYGPREFLTSNGLGSMGYAVPGALGARLAWPDRPVVAFTGDGGFLMAVAELQTSAREKLPITIVVFDDAEIGLIRVKQEIKGIPLHGVQLGGCDWEKIAQGFGADGTVVETEHGLGDALAAAARSARTTVIGVRIDGSGYVDQFNALREL